MRLGYVRLPRQKGGVYPLNPDRIFRKCKFEWSARTRNPVLILYGQRYNLVRKTKDAKSFWRCVKRNYGCTSKAVTKNEQLFNLTAHNNHNLEIKFEWSARGNPVLIVNGQRFNKDRERSGKVFWRCVKRNNGCRSSAVTVDEQLIRHTGHNNHVRTSDVEILTVLE
ncbi:uncharacterized protein LOC114355080 [Ostrinia furnacalis]|uniref:uncharacterized protein LOC114355080 n=1 Tax=Ostrinia furnacalis TaxID=93504 RepID=UPI0010390AEF|nr:uncharacterized protein LOC114355080 [Ostrinia furnacalis]